MLVRPAHTAHTAHTSTQGTAWTPGLAPGFGQTALGEEVALRAILNVQFRHSSHSVAPTPRNTAPLVAVEREATHLRGRPSSDSVLSTVPEPHAQVCLSPTQVPPCPPFPQ